MKFIDKAGSSNPIGHYSTAVELENGILLLSGQISIDESGNLVGTTVAEQTRNVLKNIKSILSELGYGIEDISKVTIFITDISKFSEVNEVYKEFFGNHKPVRTTVGVSGLPKGALVEIEVLAYRRSGAENARTP